MAIPVKLPVFEGPLDLLMHLIEKNKIDIYDIPIVEITDQYLEYVHRMDHEDMDVTSEFLVMAATLLDIKSRMLLPREKDEETGEEEADPREELVRRLLEYKLYKYLSEELTVCREEAGGRFFRAQNLPKEVRNYQPPIDYDDLLRDTDLQTLQKVFGEVLRRKKSRRDPIRSGFGKIRREEVSMDTKSLYIRAYLQAHPHTDFRALLESGSSREEVIVTFLILLELMKTQKVFIIQDNIGGRILIEAAAPKTDSDDVSGQNPAPVQDANAAPEESMEVTQDDSISPEAMTAADIIRESPEGSFEEITGESTEASAKEITGESTEASAKEITREVPEETAEEPIEEITEDSDFQEETAEMSIAKSSVPAHSTSSGLALSAVRAFRGVERIAPMAAPPAPVETIPFITTISPMQQEPPVRQESRTRQEPCFRQESPIHQEPCHQQESALRQTAEIQQIPPQEAALDSTWSSDQDDLESMTDLEMTDAADTSIMQAEISEMSPPHFSTHLWHGSTPRFMPGAWKRERLSRLWARRRYH